MIELWYIFLIPLSLYRPHFTVEKSFAMRVCIPFLLLSTVHTLALALTHTWTIYSVRKKEDRARSAFTERPAHTHMRARRERAANITTICSCVCVPQPVRVLLAFPLLWGGGGIYCMITGIFRKTHTHTLRVLGRRLWSGEDM